MRRKGNHASESEINQSIQPLPDIRHAIVGGHGPVAIERIILPLTHVLVPFVPNHLSLSMAPPFRKFTDVGIIGVRYQLTMAIYEECEPMGEKRREYGADYSRMNRCRFVRHCTGGCLHIMRDNGWKGRSRTIA